MYIKNNCIIYNVLYLSLLNVILGGAFKSIRSQGLWRFHNSSDSPSKGPGRHPRRSLFRAVLED